MNIHLKVFFGWIIVVIMINSVLLYYGAEGFTMAQIIGQSIVLFTVEIAVPYLIYYYTIRRIIDKIIERKNSSS